MPREGHQSLRRDTGGVRPASGRVQAERRGNGRTSPDTRLAEAGQQDQEAAAEDRRIRSLVQKRLAMFGPLVEDEVTASVRNGRVLLSGNVGSDYERQAILHEIERIAFVKHVRCHLTIGEEEEEEADTLAGAPLVRPQLVAVLAVLTVVAVSWWVWNWMQQ